MLLDFLYPAGTLNFLRQYSGWGVDRSDGRRTRGGLGRLGQRLYTSSAKDPSSKDRAAATDVVQGEESGIDTEDRTYTASLRELMGLTKINDYEEAWRQYLLLDDRNKERLGGELIDYFSTSTRPVDAERIVDTFNNMDPGSRDAAAYAFTIRAHLRLGHFSDASSLQKEALHALNNPAGSDELLAYMVDNSLWSHAFKLWKTIDQAGGSNLILNFNIWKPTESLPTLTMRAFDMAEYVDKQLETSGLPKGPHTELIAFASQILQRALFKGIFNGTQFMNLFDILRKWNMDTQMLYQQSVQLLMDKVQTKLAVKLYRWSRQSETTKLSRPTLHSMLTIFCEHHSILGMQQVLDDFFRFYKGPTRRAYKMCMAEFASMGDADTVHALFEQYTKKFHLKGGRAVVDATDMASILHVHARRGELEEVLKYFDLLRDEYHIKPNLVCWNILINAYGRAHDFDGAFACFEHLLESEVLQPDDYTFGTIMANCVKSGDLERTIEMYRLADSMKVEKTTVMVECLVSAHVQDERIQQAEKICEEALNMELTGSRVRMWNTLLTAYAMRRDLANVNRLLRRMADEHIDYDQFTYSCLMQALAMVKQPDRAYSILTKVMKEAGIRVTSYHYAIVMGGYLANGEYHKVFHLKNRLQRREIRHSASTKLLMMKAAYQEDQRLLESRTPEEQAERAFEIFQQTLSTADQQDIVETEQRGKRGLSIDVAYPTMFYRFVLFILATRDENETVEHLYQEYVKALPERVRDSPPTRVLSAIMLSKANIGNYSEVEHCWNLALSNALKAGAPLQPPKSIIKRTTNPRRPPPTPVKIVPSHQLDLAEILTFYMNALVKAQRVDDIINTVNKLLDDGFLLSNKNWNHYIQILAKHYRFRLAFTLCETHLMPGWTGWARIRWQLPERNRLPMEVRNLKKDPKYLRPSLRTLLWLARAWLEVKTMVGQGSEGGRMLVGDLETECPLTVGAVVTMQRTDSEVEREVLRGE